MLIAEDAESEIENREAELNENHNSKYDGTGGSISIPTLIVGEEDGKRLVDLVHHKTYADSGIILKADIDIADGGK